ncbi:MAG: hypothetical protein PSV16_00660 [Flavobacterium sp.]|nr:hypothetical protein [Flavobacterium sp.]
MSLTENFDKYNKANAPQKKDAETTDSENDIELYSLTGHVRNLDFVQPDGEREFFNYALITRCKISSDKSSIFLNYSTGHEVTIKGRNLEILYDQLFGQLPKSITAIDRRYEATKDGVEPVIFEIAINKI